jgi:hypothetical protein
MADFWSRNPPKSRFLVTKVRQEGKNGPKVPQSFKTSPKKTKNVVRPYAKSPRERGYDARWDRYSSQFRRRNPFCARCAEDDRQTLIVEGRTGVVDHKRPPKLGGDFWDRANHWGLCSSHHDGWKKQLEDHAIATDQVDKLIAWCDDPSTRPRLRGHL